MFRERIHEHYASLSPRFRTLADFILEHTLDVGFLTATELARRVGVDPATVVRFSQELGYSGYRELSREIKHYINQQLALRYTQSDPQAYGLSEQIARLMDELSHRIREMKADADQIARVANDLHAAQRIYVIATAETQGVAALWATYLNLIGKRAIHGSVDPMQATFMLRDLQTEDLLVALSIGLSIGEEVGHVLRAARERGVATVSITTSPSLIAAREATTNLVAPAQTPQDYPAFDTLMALLATLWQALVILEGEQASAGVQGTLDALNALVQQQHRAPQHDIAVLLRHWAQP